jgi:hypothetical protein
MRRAASSKQERELRTCSKFITRMRDKDRGLLIQMASKMAKRAKSSLAASWRHREF